MTKAINLPNLSDLPVHSDCSMLNHFLNSGGPRDTTAYALWMNFIRLVDVAVREYELGRQEIVGSASILRRDTVAAGHFELLLITLKRAVAHLNALRRCQTLKILLKKSEIASIRASEKWITNMRNAIAHLDERITNREIQKGEPLCLKPVKDAVELGNKSIPYSEITDVIRKLHKLAGNVALYVESTPPQ